MLGFINQSVKIKIFSFLCTKKIVKIKIFLCIYKKNKKNPKTKTEKQTPSKTKQKTRGNELKQERKDWWLLDLSVGGGGGGGGATFSFMCARNFL